MNFLTGLLAVIFVIVAFLSAVWIVVPAPFYNVWLFSVAASEWSLWLGALALAGIGAAVLKRFFYGGGNLWFVIVVFGAIALFISLDPFLSSLSAAKQVGASLSFRQYFLGAFDGKSAESNNFKTLTFARIGETALKLDVYQPTVENSNNGASVIVVHGGFWNRGERDDFPEWNKWLARQGFTVFDIDYRLAPQPNFTEATGDVKCAVRWVKNHAAEFKIAADRIALLGRSAGAHLVLLAAYSANDANLPASCAEGAADETVRAVISFYAPTDLIWAYEHPANQLIIDGPAEIAKFVGGSPLESEEIRRKYLLASPTAHISAVSPPTLLFHGGEDQLVRPDNMQFVGEKLEAAHRPFQKILIPYGQHGFDYNFNGWGSQIAQTAILKFLSENTGE